MHATKKQNFFTFFSNFYCFFINLLSLSLFSAFPIPFILIFCSFFGFFGFFENISLSLPMWNFRLFLGHCINMQSPKYLNVKIINTNKL